MTWEVLQRSGRVGRLTSSEQSVAAFYARSLPGAAFMNLQQVASTSGVSTASVTRFARKLGYEDFRVMAASLQGDARSVLERPGDRLGATPGADDRLSRAAADLQATAASLDADSVHRGVELLADTTRPVLLAAVASGQPLVEHTGLLLSYLRGNVRVLGGTDRWAHEIADISARHVVLVTAYDRDPLPLLHLVERARSTGASTIAVTNVATSPLLSSAEVPLRISTAPGTPFGSRVALLATLETLVDGVAAAQPEGRHRADAIEQSFDALGIHPRATPRLSDS